MPVPKRNQRKYKPRLWHDKRLDVLRVCRAAGVTGPAIARRLELSRTYIEQLAARSDLTPPPLEKRLEKASSDAERRLLWNLCLLTTATLGQQIPREHRIHINHAMVNSTIIRRIQKKILTSDLSRTQRELKKAGSIEQLPRDLVEFYVIDEVFPYLLAHKYVQ